MRHIQCPKTLDGTFDARFTSPTIVDSVGLPIVYAEDELRHELLDLHGLNGSCQTSPSSSPDLDFGCPLTKDGYVDYRYSSPAHLNLDGTRDKRFSLEGDARWDMIDELGMENACKGSIMRSKSKSPKKKSRSKSRSKSPKKQRKSKSRSKSVKVGFPKRKDGRRDRRYKKKYSLKKDGSRDFRSPCL